MRSNTAHLLPGKNRPRRRGVAAVEFALAMPVFVLIVLATIEACSMIFLQQSLKIAAYEGARVALVPGSTEGNVDGACQQMLLDRNVQGGDAVVTPADFDAEPYGTLISVTVSAPCDSNSLFAPWFYAGRTLEGRVEVMKEYD